MKGIFLTFSLLIFLFGCKRDPIKNIANAEVYKFNAEKCLCCWGWYVKKNDDTLKIDVLPNGVTISTVIIKPIPVYIELGEKKNNCLTIDYDYYLVNRLEIIK